MASPTHTPCPFCAKPVYVLFTTCPHCGRQARKQTAAIEWGSAENRKLALWHNDPTLAPPEFFFPPINPHTGERSPVLRLEDGQGRMAETKEPLEEIELSDLEILILVTMRELEATTRDLRETSGEIAKTIGREGANLRRELTKLRDTRLVESGGRGVGGYWLTLAGSERARRN